MIDRSQIASLIKREADHFQGVNKFENQACSRLVHLMILNSAFVFVEERKVSKRKLDCLNDPSFD